MIKKDEVKSIELQILEIVEDAVIVSIDGWRIRVYINKLSPSDKATLCVGRIINVEYTGDIEKIHSVKILPLNKL